MQATKGGVAGTTSGVQRLWFFAAGFGGTFFDWDTMSMEVAGEKDSPCR